MNKSLFVASGGLRWISVFVAVSLLCGWMSAGLAQESKIDFVALTQETQKIWQNPGDITDLTLIWWIPNEFWEASFTQIPPYEDVEAEIEDAVKIWGKYTVIAVLDGKIGSNGFSPRPDANIRANIRMRDSQGTVYLPLNEDKVSARAKKSASSLKSGWADLGPMMGSVIFFFFPARNEKGQRIADAKKEGIFSVELGEKKVKWRLPLSSLVPPKICPDCQEKLSGAYKFCPWCGIKLSETKGMRSKAEKTNIQSKSTAGKKERYEAKYQTIAHRALDLESEIEGAEPNYELLDSIIDEVKRRIKASPPYSKEEAFKILQTISDVLVEMNFLNRTNVDLLSKALQPLSLDKDAIEYLKRIEPERESMWKDLRHEESRLVPTLKQRVHALSHLDERFHLADCDIMTLLYLGIGDALMLPIHEVSAPQHAFIRWHFPDGSYLNWETLEANTLTDDEYKSWLNIPTIAVRSGAYLKSLSVDYALAAVYSNRGNAWQERGNLDRAIADIDKAIEIRSNFAEAYCNRGIAYSHKEDYERAIADFNEAIAINPNFALAHYNRAKAHYDKGDSARAIANYNKAITIDASFTAAFINRGIAYRHEGDFDRAIVDYNRAMAINPNDARCYYNRGNAYDDKGDYERAIVDYDKAIAINPDYSEAYCNRGIAYSKKSDYDRAVADFDRAIAINPNLAQAYYSRGNVYLLNGNLDHAIADCNKAIARKPNFADAYYARGLASCRKGHYDRGIADFDRAIEIKPNYAEAYCDRGIAYCKKWSDDRAIADLNKAIAINPNFARAYRNRAVAWFGKHEYKRAWADVKRCRELGESPNPKFIQLLREASGQHE